MTPGGLVVLTDRRSAAGPLPQVVAAAVRGGAAWVILRERDLPYAERAALAAELRSLLPPGRLIVAGPDPLGGAAVHLSAADPRPAGIPLTGRSWHGAEPLSDVDYVTLSPIYPTATKPGYGPALGAAGAAALIASVPGSAGLPWLALGGVDSVERAAECAAAGADGIAVLGAVMRAANPEQVARQLAGAFAAAQRKASDRPAAVPAVGGRVARSDADGRPAATPMASAGVARSDAGDRPAAAPTAGASVAERGARTGAGRPEPRPGGRYFEEVSR